MRQNLTEIFLENYHYALTSSINNTDWNSNVTHFPEVLSEYLGTKNNINIVNETNDVKQLIEYKNKNKLSFIPIKVVKLKDHKKDISKHLVNKLFQKTSYFAHMIKNLLDEFAEKKRQFAHYKISPYPEKPTDTYFPIKKFKIDSNIGQFIAELLRNGMIIKNSDNDEMKDYFINRCMNKHVKTAYLDDIPDYNNMKRKLVFVKFAPLNHSKVFSIKPKKYKIKYLGNQTVQYENNEYSISDEPINIFYLDKS